MSTWKGRRADLAQIDETRAHSPLRPAQPEPEPLYVSPSGTRFFPFEPAAPDGPPYTHTFSNPPTEYDHNGYPLPPRLQPSMTITMFPPDNQDCDPAAAFSRAIEMLVLYDLTPQDVTATGSAVSQLVADYGAQTLGIGHIRHGQRGDWFRSIRWSAPAWNALHGADGPRKGRQR